MFYQNIKKSNYKKTAAEQNSYFLDYFKELSLGFLYRILFRLGAIGASNLQYLASDNFNKLDKRNTFQDI